MKSQNDALLGIKLKTGSKSCTVDILNTNILCNEGYSKFLLNSSTFKDKLFKWRIENNLTKREASKLLGISERGYSGWEDGVIMSIKTYNKIVYKLLYYNIL